MSVLAELPAKSIVRAIAAAAKGWSDARFPPRVRVTHQIAERMGYSLPVVEYALDRLFHAISEDALTATIVNELGSLEILDGFAARKGRTDAWARPVGRVCIISSRTTIGVALPAAIFALCAKCDVLVKDREDSLVAAFFETLAAENAAFKQSAQAEAWSSADDAAPNLREFAAVVVFGRNETLERVRLSLNLQVRFIGFGSRASAGYIAREALTGADAAKQIARGAARDLVLYETEGCLSLQVLFVENGGAVSAADFSAILEKEVQTAALEFPRGAAGSERLAQVAQARALAGFRSATGSSRALDEPPAFLPRVLGAIAVNGPDEASDYLRRHGMPLEGFALAGDREDVRDLAMTAGAVRLSRFGELQDPPLAGNHGGRPRISDFITWIDKTF